jgi:hypothetical protein
MLCERRLGTLGPKRVVLDILPGTVAGKSRNLQVGWLRLHVFFAVD